MLQHILKISDFSSEDLAALFAQAKECRETPEKYHHFLNGEMVALFLQTPSLAMRVSWKKAISKLGGQSFYLGESDFVPTDHEKMKVTNKIWNGLFQLVALNTDDNHLRQWSSEASIPCINLHSKEHRPIQILSDFFWIQEHNDLPKSAKITYIGRGNATLHSLMEICALLGYPLTICTPVGFEPTGTIVANVQQLAKQSHTQITFEDNPIEAVKNADILYTDSWYETNETPERCGIIRRNFLKYQVHSNLLIHAPKNLCILHGQPFDIGEEMQPDIREKLYPLIELQLNSMYLCLMACVIGLLNPCFKGKNF